MKDNQNNLDLDRNLFALAFSVIRVNWLASLLATVLLLASYAAAGYIDGQILLAVMRTLIIIIVGFSIYRVLLSRGQVRGFQALATDDGRIGWRYAGVMVMILSPIFLLGIIWTAPGSGVGPQNFAEIGFGLVMVIAYGAGYVLFGTALPEVVERGDVAMGEAIQRGRQNYRVIGRSLVLGPWLFRALSMLVMVVLASSGVTTDLFTGGYQGTFQPAALGPMLFFSASYVFAETMTAIVLLRAYRRYPVVPKGVAA